MQFKTLVFFTLFTAAAAQIPTSQCTTGPVQCCGASETAGEPNASRLLYELGIVVESLDVLVGITCSPISAIGAESTACFAEPLCCESNDFGGLVSVGCVPIDIET
ncbi:hypothetical protein VNI00_009330 [Paramarasmius palmivorus]|uniref:Hydrophobin n=1 Tax=Paramarasmius palmivorus TaxID=297713 RepID=A0AAW0CS48_9AGAR